MDATTLPAHDELEPALRERLTRLQQEGREIFARFDDEVRRHEWHPFKPANYAYAEEALLALRGQGLSFLEWGSATGVVAIMADMLGFDAYGIEIDPALVDTARELADRFDSGARFAAGSFLPDGYEWTSPTGDHRLGTIGHAPSGYPELGRPLDSFDLVFGYPWGGEEPLMQDVMRAHGSPDARLLLHGSSRVDVFRHGTLVS